MATDFWAAQRAADTTRTWDAAGEAIAGNFARRDQRRAEAEGERLSADIDRQYKAAMAAAAVSGENLPEGLQGKVGVDLLIRQVVIKNVALQELARLAPNHPLTRPEVRTAIARQGLKNFNSRGRPHLSEKLPADAMTPADDVVAQIFAQKL